MQRRVLLMSLLVRIDRDGTWLLCVDWIVVPLYWCTLRMNGICQNLFGLNAKGFHFRFSPNIRRWMTGLSWKDSFKNVQKGHWTLDVRIGVSCSRPKRFIHTHLTRWRNFIVATVVGAVTVGKMLRTEVFKIVCGRLLSHLMIYLMLTHTRQLVRGRRLVSAHSHRHRVGRILNCKEITFKHRLNFLSTLSLTVLKELLETAISCSCSESIGVESGDCW